MLPLPSKRPAAALRGLLAFVASTLLAVAAPAQPTGKPEPTYRNVKYDSHERNVLDFWRADAAKPTPFVMYVHGGGFSGGSKDSLNAALLKELLEAGISVAAVNYRFYRQAPLPASLHDCRRALQFLRSKAGEWNLDPARAGATGGSAGAVVSMYLAFHDDMADRASSEPVLRESTRLRCVATGGGQTTLDLDWWLAHIPGWPADHGARESVMAGRWGLTDEAAYRAIVAECSALQLVTGDDPPIWMNYGMAPTDAPPADAKQAYSWALHHVNFGGALKERMDALGVEATLTYPRSPDSKRYAGMAGFFIAKLKSPP